MVAALLGRSPLAMMVSTRRVLRGVMYQGRLNTNIEAGAAACGQQPDPHQRQEGRLYSLRSAVSSWARCRHSAAESC